METTKTLNTTVEAFDAFLMDMILQDINNATGKKVPASKIKEGYSYNKKIMNKTGKSGNVITRIEKLESGLYQVAIESKNGINYIQYAYQDTPDNTILLTYSESFETESKLKDWNHSIMSKLYSKSTRRRVTVLLDQIDHLMQENQESV